MAYTDDGIKAGIDELLAAGYTAEQIVQVAVEKGVDHGQLVKVGVQYAQSPEEQNAMVQLIDTTYKSASTPTATATTTAPVTQTAGTPYGFSAETNNLLSEIWPEWNQMSDSAKLQFYREFTAQPQEVQDAQAAQVMQQYEQFKTSQMQSNTNWGIDAWRQVFGKEPSPADIQTIQQYFQSGGTREGGLDWLRQQPGSQTVQGLSALDAYKYGLDPYSPTYGTQIGGLSLPSAPSINTAQGMAQYGQTAGGVTGADIRAFVNQYGANSTEVQQAMQKYGITQADVDSAMASTDPNLRYGGYEAVRYGDTLGKTFDAQTIRDYVSQYGEGSPEVRQAMQQYGITQSELQNALANTDPNMTFGGARPVDYAADVADPMSQWQYESSPAYAAKRSLMSQDINNRLASRGIRGATAVNILEDQTRKLVAEDYGNERDYAFNQLLQKYQSQGLEYNQAYTAAQQEYGNALTSQNQLAQQGATDSLQNYQMQLAQYQDMYSRRATEAASAYDKIINEIKIGQNAAGTISSAGQNLSNQTSNALGTAGQAAATSAMQSGIASVGLYSGLGNVGANLLGSTSTQNALGSLFSGLGSTTGTSGYLGA